MALQIDQNKCVLCGMCKQNCPMQAIDIVDGKMVIDESKCVNCMTCATWCPQGAISAK